MSALPVVIAGPMLRHVDATCVTVWLVTSTADSPGLALNDSQRNPVRSDLTSKCFPIGTHAYVHLLQLHPEEAIHANTTFFYDLVFSDEQHQSGWNKQRGELCYDGEDALSFCWQPTLTNVLHGSCRKPHHPEPDAILRVDALVGDAIANRERRPDLLLLTGDQVYTDDVAGPMLLAIQALVAKLGLFQESLQGAVVAHSDELAGHPCNLYERQLILPQIATNTALSKLFFGAKKKPVFTSVNAQNHLITFAEMMAMYLLVWSPEPWAIIGESEHKVNQHYLARYNKEKAEIKRFAESLKEVRRVLAHLPTYMIFDDHDVTDDWNLTRGWEDEVYNHPLSRRMIGNALMAYFLCQGWGNQPHKFADLEKEAERVLTPKGIDRHDQFIDSLLNFEDWHYNLNTTPPIQVLDTRTHRWRSESSLNKPSGLMDWEALCEFQQAIIGKPAVIVVSAAPIYGVKAIEAIQKVFTFFGKALTVDAENWMAHRGTANVMLNIFRHYKTPPEFIILSGDVHYSFVYDVRLRFRRNSPHITQFTCSGIKNSFPTGLLRCMDQLNRWFYGPTSPLNIFTRRRYMSVRARPPANDPEHELLNKAAIGQLVLTQKDTTVLCRALCSDGETVEFLPVDHR